MRNNKTKQGAASLYVVIFTTLLLGIITLGFIRIMLSETIQTNNADLSQSAFDSALAGVEDAKIALLKYHECLSGDSTTESCVAAITAMQHQDSTTNCDVVRDILSTRSDGTVGETIIQSTTGEGGAGSEMEQAYTCVLISEDNPDYLGQLNANYHSKIVPIRTADVNSVKYVNISWYSSTNASSDGIPANTDARKPASSLKSSNKPDNYEDSSNTGLFPALDSANPSVPPTLGVQLIQTGDEFNYGQLDSNNGDNTNRGTLLLYPASTASTNIIENSALTGFAASSDKAINIPTAIKCEPNDSNAEFHCSAILALPKPFDGSDRSAGSTFLRLFLPYGTPDTDFSVTLCKDSSCGETMLFLGVQARIDSTGRANDLFRRIESRIELVDVYFPFPEYSAAIKGTAADTINKNFWVTHNNWDQNGAAVDSGQVAN